MKPKKRMYIDFSTIQDLLNIMTKIELLDFFNKRIIIPIDDSSYDFLIVLKGESDLIVNNVQKN